MFCVFFCSLLVMCYLHFLCRVWNWPYYDCSVGASLINIIIIVVVVFVVALLIISWVWKFIRELKVSNLAANWHCFMEHHVSLPCWQNTLLLSVLSLVRVCNRVSYFFKISGDIVLVMIFIILPLLLFVLSFIIIIIIIIIIINY
jgi:hypothetical protein